MKRPRQKKLGTERESKQEEKQRRQTLTLQTFAIKEEISEILCFIIANTNPSNLCD